MLMKQRKILLRYDAPSVTALGDFSHIAPNFLGHSTANVIE